MNLKAPEASSPWGTLVTSLLRALLALSGHWGDNSTYCAEPRIEGDLEQKPGTSSELSSGKSGHCQDRDASLPEERVRITARQFCQVSEGGTRSVWLMWPESQRGYVIPVCRNVSFPYHVAIGSSLRNSSVSWEDSDSVHCTWSPGPLPTHISLCTAQGRVTAEVRVVTLSPITTTLLLTAWTRRVFAGGNSCLAALLRGTAVCVHAGSCAHDGRDGSAFG